MARRGHDRERRVRAFYEKDDWIVLRAAGSLGPVDLIALKAETRPLMIEVKSTAGGPYERFGPAERKRMLRIAKRAGADATLAWWPPRGHLALIPSVRWPA